MDVPILADIAVETSHMTKTPTPYSINPFKGEEKRVALIVVSVVGTAVFLLLSSRPEKWYVGAGLLIGYLTYYMGMYENFSLGFAITYMLLSLVWSLAISQPQINLGLAMICSFLIFFLSTGALFVTGSIYHFVSLIWSIFAIVYSIHIESMV